MKKIKVSIVCISYNQENYIAQTLESFVSQEPNFNFEVIIADDKSSDNTPNIINEYALRYPDIIKPVLRRKNLGPQQNFVDALKRATGDYIAICEGDDFWTDTQKLQKQADFLDTHDAYNIVFHPVRVFFENHEEEDAIYPLTSDTKEFTLKNLLKNNYIQTNSVMYRKINYDRLSLDVMPFDWYLHLSHVGNGKIGFINDVMSAYRRHAGGIWWNQHSQPQLIWKKYAYNYLKLLHEIMLLHGKNTENKKIINNHISGSYEAIASLLPDDDVNNMVTRSIAEMPLETWNYIKHLIQQVDHYSKHDAYLNDVLEHETHRNEQIETKNTQLSHELNAIKTSKAWRMMRVAQQGKKSIQHPINAVKRITHHLRSKVTKSKNR